MLRPNVAKNFGEIMVKANQRAIAISTCRYGDEKSVLDQVKETVETVANKVLETAATTVDTTRDLGNTVAENISGQLRSLRTSPPSKERQPLEKSKSTTPLDSLSSEQRAHHEAVYQMSRDMVDSTKDHDGEYELRDLAARNATKAKHESKLL